MFSLFEEEEMLNIATVFSVKYSPVQNVAYGLISNPNLREKERGIKNNNPSCFLFSFLSKK